MADFALTQPERRSYLIPGILVAALVGVAIFLILRFTPHRIADLSVTHTSVLPIHTVMKSPLAGIKVVGKDETEDDLYVLATVRLQDQLKLPIQVNDITATLTTADGSTANASAIEKNDLANTYAAYPALKPLSSPPLLRDSWIEPGATAEGMVLLHFPVTQSIWDQRQSAIITIDTYHQGPLTVTIPK